MFLGWAGSRVDVNLGFENVVLLMERERIGSVIACAVMTVMARRIASRHKNIS